MGYASLTPPYDVTHEVWAFKEHLLSNHLGFLGSVLGVLLVSGCVSQALETPLETPTIVQTDAPEPASIIKPEPIKQPLQIATWSPTPQMGRFTAMNAGYLRAYQNCLVLTRDKDSLPTDENSLLLVLADTSFSWDEAEQTLVFEGKPYKLGDELYLGGGSFTYPVGILTDQVEINWKECGLSRGWLGG